MKKISFLLLAALALGSCKKNDDNSPAAPSKTDLLTAKNWRITAQKNTTTFGTQTSTTDEYAALSACERDNFAKFNTNKTVVFDEGATKCSTSDPQTESGTWDFNSDQSKLNLTDPSLGGVVIPFDIVELSATTLHVRYTNSASGVSSTEDVTFTAF
jgi:hypothetical protein